MTDELNNLEQSYQQLLPLSLRWRKEFRLHKHTLDTVKKYLGDLKGKKILDIGCGLGILVHALNKSGAGAEGIDKNILQEWKAENIESAWSAAGLKIIVNDFFETDLGAECYDAVISENMIEHLKYSQKEFFNKVYAMLKPGGLLFLATPNLLTFSKRLRMLLGKSPYWDLKDFFLAGQPYGHTREFTAQELKTMCELGGFDVLKIEKYNVYFERKWIGNIHKISKFGNWLLSEIFPPGRDLLFVIAKKII